MNITDERLKPWYQQPYVWLIIFFPLATILASIVTIILAVKSNDGLVVDDYYKRGLEVNKVLERDQVAKEYNLKANLVFLGNDPAFTINLEGDNSFTLPEKIKVTFLHPTRKGMDHKFELYKGDDNVYRGISPELAPGKWYVQIETDDWRLFMNYTVIKG